jgi:hypothetical protein
MGFKVVTYNVLLPAAMHAVRATLTALKNDDLAAGPPRLAFDELTDLVGLPAYTALERRYGTPES